MSSLSSRLATLGQGRARRILGVFPRARFAFVALALFAPASVARAVTGPDFDTVQWTALTCTDATEAPGDTTPSSVDLVGDAAHPAVYMSLDADFLYFRYRVDQDPSGAKGFDQNAWTALMQVPSGNAFQYQYELALDGKGADDDFGNTGGSAGDTVEVWANTSAEDIDFSPLFNDPAEMRVFAQRYDFSGAGTANTAPLARLLPAGDGSAFGGNSDYFVDFAFPVSALIAKGVVADAAQLADSVFFPATSTNANNYNKDHLACSFLPPTTLSIEKTATPAAVPVNAVTAVSYSIVVQNIGVRSAKGLVIEDPLLPAYVSNVQVDVTASDPSVTWEVVSTDPLKVKVPLLPIGASVTVTIKGDATPGCTDQDFTNIATVFGTNAMQASGSATLHPDLTEICDGADNDCNGLVDEGGSALCDDGDACNGQETCGGAAGCQQGTPVVCTPSDQCHDAGTCEPTTGACSNPAKPDATTCDDGDACTRTDTCQGGSCVGTTPVVCSASDQCHAAGTCDPTTGTCSNPAKPNGTTCNDGNPCTRTDTCQGGSCLGANPVVCTASDQCHAAGSCNPMTGACSNPAKPNGTTCNDGNLCTRTDTCQGGSCIGADAVVCTASDQCHAAGTCDSTTGACSNPARADATTCDDGNACTGTDTCQAGSCVGADPVVCTASDQCHTAGACDPATGACSNPALADATTCDDGNACTRTDTCQGGSCIGTDPVVCTASDQCHAAGACDPATGSCSAPAKTDGAVCDDGDACTQSDTCQGGTCVGASPVVCSALDQCHDAGTCDPSTGTCSSPEIPGCIPCNTDDDCDDQDACTVDTCSAGVCVSTASENCGRVAEICGDCIDNDGDGLVDYEDPDCCGEPLALNVKRLRIRPTTKPVPGHRLRLRGLYAQLLAAGFDPMTQTTEIQLSEPDGQIFCTTIPPKYWKHPRKRLFKFRDKTGTLASGLRKTRFKVTRKGRIFFGAAGRNMSLPPAQWNNVRVTVSVGDQCSTSTLNLRAVRKGVVFP
jgi:hypothetical protein